MSDPTKWLAVKNSEAARLAYVASSRPEHFFAWAVHKPINKQEEKTIRNLGFHMVEISEMDII